MSQGRRDARLKALRAARTRTLRDDPPDSPVSLTGQLPVDILEEEEGRTPAEVPGWYSEWIAAWLQHQRRRGRANASLQTWSWALRDFGGELAAHGVQSPGDLTRQHLQSWQDRLSVRLSPGSQHVAVSALRGLLKWADREELTPRSGLGLWLDSPRVPDSLPRDLAPSDLRAILAFYAPPPRTLERARDRALFLFLVTTGARITEALRVDVEPFRRGPIRVRQKGGGEQLLVPSARARDWTLEYLRRRGRDDDPALWVRLGAGRRSPRRMQFEDANKIWHALAARLDVPDFTSHALRHTLAMELLSRGANELELQAQLGHASLATIHRYVRVRAPRRQQLVDQLDDLVPEQPRPPDGRRPRRR